MSHYCILINWRPYIKGLTLIIKKFSKSGCIYWLFPIHLRSDPINMIVSNTFKISNNHSCCSDVMWAATDIHWYYWDAPHLIVLYRTVRYSTVQECTVLYITTEYSKCRTNEHCTKQQIYNGILCPFVSYNINRKLLDNNKLYMITKLGF